jgi:tetratricopeptide (TPR) repeat protein
MKASQQNRSRWVYISLILMLLALLSFSMLPLLSSIIQNTQFSSRTASPLPAGSPQNPSPALEAKALGYQMVLEREPDNQNALRGLLEVKLQQGDIKGTIEPLEKIAQLNPQQLEYPLLLAQAKQQIDDYRGAEETYRGFLASHPEDIRGLKGMVDLFLVQDRQDDAVNLVKNTLSRVARSHLEQPQPANQVDTTSLQLLLGEIYVSQKNYPEAIALYDQAMGADKQDFRPVLAKAWVLQEQGNASLAAPLFKQAATLAPTQYKEQIQAIALSKAKPGSRSE